MSLPGYEFISVPLWLLTTLHILTLALHFLAMNFVLGGLIIVLWGKFTNRWDHPVVRQFIKLFPSLMAATVSFGVAPLLFVQLVFHRQIYSASIVSGWFWLMIILAVMLSYYFLYGASFGTSSNRKGLYLLLALIGMLYVSLVYSSVFTMAERPDLITLLYAANQSGAVLNGQVGDWIFRWLHMITGAITVGGFFVGLIGHRDNQAFAVGKAFYLWGMIVSSLVGLVYLLTLGEYLVPFMRTPGIWALTLAVLLSIGSLHFFFKQRFVPASLMLFVSLLGMVISRHYVRLLKLQPFFDPATPAVQPQWGPFLLFLVCFVLMLGIVWYMLNLFFNPKHAKQ
jgi:hypothetical protein